MNASPRFCAASRALCYARLGTANGVHFASTVAQSNHIVAATHFVALTCGSAGDDLVRSFPENAPLLPGRHFVSGRQLLGLPAKANTGEAIAQQRTLRRDSRSLPHDRDRDGHCGHREVGALRYTHLPSLRWSGVLDRRVCRPVGRQLADGECSCRGSPRWMWGAAAAASLRLRSASMESITPLHPPSLPVSQSPSHRAHARVCIVNKE